MSTKTEKKKEMVRLYVEEKFGLKAISDRMGCNRTVVRLAVVKAGHRMRTAAEGKQAGREMGHRVGGTLSFAEARDKADAEWVVNASKHCKRRWKTGRVADAKKAIQVESARLAYAQKMAAMSDDDMIDLRAKWRNRASQSKEYRNALRRNHPKSNEKAAAHSAVHEAIKSGNLQPITVMECTECGDSAQHYHHWSYKREHFLDVQPVCRACHVYIHSGKANLKAEIKGSLS